MPSQKFAAYDSTGKITGFYSDDVVPVPAGVTSIPITEDEWQAAIVSQAHTVVDGKLVAPPDPTDVELLAKAKIVQISKLSAACQKSILAGFTFNGSNYPSSAVDQQNLSDAMNASLRPDLASGWTTSLWCRGADGTWSFAAHTTDQVHQVHGAWLAFRLGQQQLLITKRAQVNSATTVAAVQAVSW